MPFPVDLAELAESYREMSDAEFALIKRSDLTQEAAVVYEQEAAYRASVVHDHEAADRAPVRQVVEPTLVPGRRVAGLRRRSIAFGIDAAILGLVGLVLVLLFSNAFSSLGPWGPLVGFCVAFPYFAIFDSTIGNGQTPGKRLRRVKVVDSNGGTIPFRKAAVRYVVIGLPWFLNSIVFPARTAWFVSAAVWAVLAVGGASLYLVAFNRGSRQGIHDLAVGSFVAEADESGALRIEPMWRFHWVILGALLISGFVAQRLLNNPQLVEDARLVEGVAGVQAAQGSSLTAFGKGQKKTTLVMNVYWSRPAANRTFWENLTTKGAEEESIAGQVAKLIFEHDPTLKEYDSLKVVMIRGYDIGLAKSYVSSPYEWNTRSIAPP